MKVKDQIQQLLQALNEGLYEKEETMALALLSAIAGESIFLLGAPGVAKSLIARRLKFAFKEGKAYEYLMNRFSTPDEIFGPVSITALKQDKYERITDDYLPGATVVFLDEIWKAGPSIQNALLTVLNEKVYRNGAQEVKVPMKALISASNELPAKGEGLEALWDRFIVRIEVGGIEDQKAFEKMISATSNAYKDNVEAALKITENVYNAWRVAVDNIKIPPSIFQVIHMVRAGLQAMNDKDENLEMYVSDRRWLKIVRILRCSAFLNGREEVDLMDCFLIMHCIWDDVDQIESVQMLVQQVIEKHGYKLNISLVDFREELKEIDAEVIQETSFIKPVTKQRVAVYEGQYYKVPTYGEYYISIAEYDSLHAINSNYIRIFQKSNAHYMHRTNEHGKKGNKKFSVVIGNGYNNQQHDLEMESFSENIKSTRKPHQSTKEHFDKRISQCKLQVKDLIRQIEEYRKKDLKHLRTNLFVDEYYADVVEANLRTLQKEINQLDIEADRIKNYYETVEDQSK